MARNYKRDSKGRFASSNTLSGKQIKSAHKRVTKIKAETRPRGKAKGAVVPYARVGLRSSSVGVNSGANIPGTEMRVSAGAFLRVERRKTPKLDKLVAMDNAALDKIAGKISPHPLATPYVKQTLINSRRKLINRHLGGQARVGKSGYARLTTSAHGLPSVTVRRGKQRVSTAKRQKGIADFNDRMGAIRGTKVKKARMARRGGRRQRRAA